MRILAVKVGKYLEWNDLTWRDDGRQAIERLHPTNNFPEFTGRLCPAPCTHVCGGRVATASGRRSRRTEG
ncbi:hypothetical protein E3T54_15515 [Cryobacterium sp. Sr8]|nr:hypothetical protein E3T54_15515 [Cryobacterium sp. Sr8]